MLERAEPWTQATQPDASPSPDAASAPRRPRATAEPRPTLPPGVEYVHLKQSGDGRWRASYRRKVGLGEYREKLPHPADPGFYAAWEAEHRKFLRQRAEPGAGKDKPWTVAGAIADYLGSAGFPANENTARQYRYHLELMRCEFGDLSMKGIDWTWVDRHRTNWAKAHRANTWNEIRKVMVIVTDRFMNKFERILPRNPWDRVARLPAPKSTQNQPWPDDVIVDVFRAATPQFRALLYVYAFTGSRGGDAVRFGDEDEVAYGPETRVLRFTAQKGGMERQIVAPETLHRALTGPDGRSLLLTPRGRKWTTANAQETLARIRDNLGLDQYTLHGLRATVASRLGELGYENLVLMAQAGWTDTRMVERYTRGARQRRMQAPAAAALEGELGPLARLAEAGANQTRAAGLTGKAAAKAGIGGRARSRRKSPTRGQ